MTNTFTAVFLSLPVFLANGPAFSRCAQGFVPRSPPASTATSKPARATSPLKPAFVPVRGGDAAVKSPSSSLGSETATSSDVVAEKVQPWESLESELEQLRSGHGEEKKPVLTLYRDTNGWCPFCERVWVAIRAKGIPYQETLVSLQKKPEWYKQMVPTALVPAVLFHGDEENGQNEATTSRELVWESDAILEALDAKFPDTVQLMKKGDKAFDDALDLHDRLQKAGFQFAYGNRNGTLTDEEIQKSRDDFDSVLDELDAALGDQASSAGTEKCFRLGTEFSGVDAIMIPTLERWRYQLPITENLDILENRKHLKNWFDTMENYEAYGRRVAGDEYSWTATASMFLRYFGGGEDRPEVAERIARANAAAEKLASEFVSASTKSASSQDAALEAAAKLIANHEAVVNDCVREEKPLSQMHIPRATLSGKDAADRLLRHVCSLLLDTASAPSTEAASPNANRLLDDCDADASAQGALALQTVSKRLCVPRDMGAPSAALLRGLLSSVADDVLADGAKTAEAVVS